MALHARHGTEQTPSTAALMQTLPSGQLASVVQVVIVRLGAQAFGGSGKRW